MHYAIQGFMHTLETVGVPVALALFAYFLGLKAYHHQKEFKLIRKRYLDNTLDLFVAHVENCLSVHRMNWQRGLEILAEFRNAGEMTPLENVTAPIHRIDHANLQIAAAHRLGRLLNGDTTFFAMQQLLVAFVERGACLIQNDLLSAIRKVVDGSIPRQAVPDAVQQYEERLRNLNAEATPYYSLLVEAQNIGMEFEKRRFSMKTLNTFYRHHEVSRAVERARAALQEIMDVMDEKSTESTQ